MDSSVLVLVAKAGGLKAGGGSLATVCTDLSEPMLAAPAPRPATGERPPRLQHLPTVGDVSIWRIAKDKSDRKAPLVVVEIV